MESPEILCFVCCFSYRGSGSCSETGSSNYSQLQLFCKLLEFLGDPKATKWRKEECSEKEECGPHFDSQRNVLSSLRLLLDSSSCSGTGTLSICPDCLGMVIKTVNIWEAVDTVERRVRELQIDILKELRLLKKYVGQFSQEVHRIQETIANSDEKCLNFFMDKNEGHYWNQGAPNESCINGDIRLFREKILKMANDLENQRDYLNVGVTGESQDSPFGNDKCNSDLRRRISTTRTSTTKNFDVAFDSIKDNIDQDQDPSVPVLDLQFDSDAIDIAVKTEPELDGPESTLEEILLENYTISNLTEFVEGEPITSKNSPLKDMDENETESGSITTSSESIEISSQNKDKSRLPTKKPLNKSRSCRSRLAAKSSTATVSPRTKFKLDLSNEDISRMGPFKRAIVLRALKRKAKREADLADKLKGKKKLKSTSNLESFQDPRQIYYVQYLPEKDQLVIGEVEVIINEKDKCLQCSLCSYIPNPIRKSNQNITRDNSMERYIFKHVIAKHMDIMGCFICGKRFQNEWRFKEHMKAHAGPVIISFCCDICGRPCSTSDSLSQHKWTHFSKTEKEEAIKNGGRDPRKRYTRYQDQQPNQNFPCPTCGKCFSTDSNLRQHEKTHDSANRSHVICPECGKMMLRSSYDNYHKTFSCPGNGEVKQRVKCLYCEVTFKNVRFMKRHLKRSHSSAVDERPCICEICKKGFKTKDCLWNHKQIHNTNLEWKCQKCGKDFNTRKNWKRHICKKSGGGAVVAKKTEAPLETNIEVEVINEDGMRQTLETQVILISAGDEVYFG